MSPVAVTTPLTLNVEAEVRVVEALDTLVMARRVSLFFTRQRPIINGIMPRIREPKPNTNIDPTFDRRRTVWALGPVDVG